MRTHYKENKLALRCALGTWLMLVLCLWGLPVAFSGYLESDLDTVFWYAVSESGGVYGTAALAVTLCLAAAWQQARSRHRARAFAVGFGFLLLLLGSTAALNEYGVKPLLHQARPSHVFLLGEAQSPLLAEFYRKPVPERQAYLEHYLQENAGQYAGISPLVLAHWVAESGYSFPSGHSQNAFLLATMLAFWLCGQLPARRRGWCLLPLGWALLVCLSRVALGVHSELDVSLGAAAGLVLAYLLSLTGLLPRVFALTKPETN
ncbi:phosphatase PAP2 family protein [Pontibacter mangrovi]|uniref:Phosphatase PAP2 family protein n=1 Tax=Pontibacter mangrovi TaxID=2589816 RepID=A0A501VZK1_9BACT|nr:phosphatase PAP2 family protein [Pontibacter mangrovi]TPE42468.1 phosphatase PAP2 family protein [Pontibacter mangrovi]